MIYNPKGPKILRIAHIEGLDNDYIASLELEFDV